MQIRSLEVNDYDAIMDLWQRSGLSALRPNGRDSRDAFSRQLQSGTTSLGADGCQVALGILKDNQLIGAVIATHDGRKGWINRLAIDPKHRRKGLATQLVAAAEETLKAQGIRVIAALIEQENEASLALFQQIGYRLHDDICYLSKRDSAEA
jgi:ribosomal protein S18 acetylase RimI-like enzyme